jgi:hypothetical protein
LVPHFSRENGFPEDDQYNMGNMFDMDSEENLLAPNVEFEMKDKASGYFNKTTDERNFFMRNCVFKVG